MPKVKTEKKYRQHGSSQQGIQFNKTFGQHILKNPLVVTSMVEKSGIQNTDVVLEVGPGTGNLTEKLLEKARKVIACEVDTRLVAELQKRVMLKPYYRNLEIKIGDVLKKPLPKFDLCISNLPYQISSPFIFKLIHEVDYFRSAILMLQKEFADRLVAQPGDELYCRLSVNVQMFARVDHLMKVSRNSFKPPPEVDSSIIRLEKKNSDLPRESIPNWDGLLRICFLRKNKTLSAIFRQASVINLVMKSYQAFCATNKIDISEDFDIKGKVLDILNKNNFADKRARHLDIDDFLKLLVVFNKEGIYFS
ncbi:DIMT1 [Cordylochernes scorpioides]|uniref:rRNA adenine N(6)-methyltransferase n=1 Tax=Cordylochernes scorpioides TaxID=51811 RepID=A0ABY6K9R9_9ARAC|nr:DIMT1 [Cordylochernes scorpioides]